MLKNIFRNSWKTPRSTPASDALKGIDAETLDLARELAFEKRLKRDVNAKWRRGRKGDAAISDDELLEALRELKPDATRIMRKVFERTVEDTVLANRFTDRDGKAVAHLTVKKAVAMDGLRDIDDDVGVSAAAAGPMNPEGRFNVPLSSNGNHPFTERFNEAMNPIRNGRFNCTIPEQILEHFANFSTFIGYPICEVIATHPTVSNACTIPGEDAIAPGYNLSFVDSDDVNGNGVPDDLETAELGGVTRSLGRLAAIEALKDAVVALGRGDSAKADGTGVTEADTTAELNALAVALERLAAYEQWERESGEGEDAAVAVNEGFVKPISDDFVKFTQNPTNEARKTCLSSLSLVLSDLSKQEHPKLDEVRANAARRGTIAAMSVAYETLVRPEEDWALSDALNHLAVAVERVGAYETLSGTNAEVMASLTSALTNLAAEESAETRARAVEAVRTAKAAMDADDFDWGGVDPMRHAEVLERERLEDRQAKADAAARIAAAKEGRISELHKQKMGIIERQALERQKAAEALAEAKGRSIDAQETRADEAHRQKLEIAQQMAEQKMRHDQAQFEAAQREQAMAQRQAAEMAEQEAEKKRKDEEKQDEVRKSAEVAKARQKFLDDWKNRADAMGINDVCARMARNARIFGIGIAIPMVDGADYDKPLDLAQIREGAYRGFTVIEPLWIYPEVESDDLTNPLSPTFFEPMYWAATGSTNLGNLGIRRIHRSWMVIVRNKEVPNMLRPMYYYGGIPLTQEIYEAVFCADKVMNEVPKLAMTKRTTVVKGDPNDMVTNPEGVVNRLQAYSQVQDNFGILYVGRNADVQKLETSLSEFDQLIAKCNQRIAAIAKMPETKLFKTQLAGMNSAGRYEWDDYSQLLINIQNNWYKPLLALHYKLDTVSRTGKVIDLKVSFNPIDVPTQAEKGEAESRVVQTINQAVQGGWLTPGEARTIARSREDSMFSSISAEMPEELSQQAQQGGGMPGMGGGGDPMAAMMGGAGVGAGSPLDAPDAPKEAHEPEEKK